MTDQELERRLRDWYRSEIPAEEMAPAALRSSVAAIPKASPARWRMFGSRRGFTLLAAAALVGLLAGSLALGGIFRNGPAPSDVLPSQLPSAQPSISAQPSAIAPLGLIAYVKFVPLEAVGGDCERGATGWYDDQRPTGCSRIWVSNTDGTDAHELLPDHHGYQTPLSWSPDGTRLLLEDAAGLWLADASGTVVQSLSFEVLCPIGCPTVSGYEFSPDGATIAFARPLVTIPEESVIALVDVATGHVTELASTASDRNDAPHWSPDGTRLTFARQQVGPSRATLFMVDVDGSNLHQYVPLNLYAIEPRWSPDGSLIAFFSDEEPGGGDIYAVGPDGSGLRRLTSDGAASRPAWTANGRLVFAHAVGDPSAPTGFELWIMDADGANKAKLPVEDVAQLTAASCLVCAWVRDPNSEIPITEFMINALWQPTP
jgi:dipeptidyl aminopeptidase/acylaminoacyl peptidase